MQESQEKTYITKPWILNLPVILAFLRCYIYLVFLRALSALARDYLELCMISKKRCKEKGFKDLGVERRFTAEALPGQKAPRTRSTQREKLLFFYFNFIFICIYLCPIFSLILLCALCVFVVKYLFRKAIELV